MKFYQKFLTFSRGKQIAIGVCFVHFLALCCLLVHHLATSRFKTPRPMVVRNVQLRAEVERQKAEVVEKKPAAEKPKPIAKIPEKPKPVAKTPEKPKPVAKKAAPKPSGKEERALKEIAGSLETLSTESRKRPALTLPSKIQPKKQFEVREEPTYGEFLIAYLQNMLDLPEFGEVKAKVEIDRFGKLIDCKIIEAKSFKNAEFLKNQLQDLTFPCLNDFGIIDATHTFTITFRNVENR